MYLHSGEKLPEVGRREALIDSEGRRVAVIETTDVKLVRLGDVDSEFARKEGEGFTETNEWRRAHERFWDSLEMKEILPDDFVINDDTIIVQEFFRVVYLS